MFKYTATVALVAGFAATAPPGSAQTPRACGERESLVADLGTQFQEELVAAGLHDPQHLVELWVSKSGETWTLLLTRADGYSCIVSAGSAWLSYEEPQSATDIGG